MARIVNGAFRSESTPPTIEPTVPVPIWQWALSVMFRFVTRYCLELSYVMGLLMIWSTGEQVLSGLGFLVVAVIVAGVCIHRPSRRRVFGSVSRRKFRRRWGDAVRHGGLATYNDHVPTPVRNGITNTPAGERLFVRIPSGSTAEQLAGAAEAIATHLEVREVRVTRHLNNARYATVDIVRRDPLSEAGSLSWPHLECPWLSMWDPIPVGVDEYGETVYVSLVEQNLLLGGLPGSGKSVSVSPIAATAALDPGCRLTLLDGKQVELSVWSSCAEALAGPDINEANAVLAELRSEMDSRYARILAAGKRKVSPGDGIPLHVVVCDELAYYLTMGDRTEVKEFTASFRDLVARGRAAGIITIAATQKPSSDIVPTSLRDLFAFRWALRCSTPQASDSILGQGWSTAGFSAQDIDASCRGVGYLLHEGGEPRRIKSFCLDDQDLRNLAARGAALRSPLDKEAA